MFLKHYILCKTLFYVQYLILLSVCASIDLEDSYCGSAVGWSDPSVAGVAV